MMCKLFDPEPCSCKSWFQKVAKDFGCPDNFFIGHAIIPLKHDLMPGSATQEPDPPADVSAMDPMHGQHTPLFQWADAKGVECL